MTTKIKKFIRQGLIIVRYGRGSDIEYKFYPYMYLKYKILKE